ncbi:MAG: hypothetical protein PF508_17205 [Spirochaeta sp.]|jgi:PHD/YefM family antitoxin component YafN of YafNO toxin-antitoxin module|nr:hypothetical protein [Spirochaeta sp.]
MNVTRHNAGVGRAVSSRGESKVFAEMNRTAPSCDSSNTGVGFLAFPGIWKYRQYYKEGRLLSNVHHPHADFVTDQNGNRKAVILSFEDYQELLEDLDDLAVVAERQSEDTISHAELERELKGES